MSLEQDIARIAALRGKSAGEYDARPRGVRADQLDMVTRMSGNPVRDQKAFDDLPSASRQVIADWPGPLNPMAWASLLEQFDEMFLIRAFEAYWLDVHGTPGEPIRRKPRRRLS